MGKRFNVAAYQCFIQALVGVDMDINGMCTLYELARMRGDIETHAPGFHTKLVALEQQLHEVNAMQFILEEGDTDNA